MVDTKQRRKISILHIIQANGGVERYIRSFLKYINRTNFYNILVCSKNYNAEDYADLADDFESVEMLRDINFRTDILAVVTIRRLIKKYRPDVVYCHSSKAGAVGRIANLGMKNKSIYNPHGWAFNMNCSKKWLYIFIERLLALVTDKIICISEAEQKSAMDKKVCKREKTVVICNGIDFEEYERVGDYVTREQIGIAQDAFVVGFVGRLSEQKSPDIFAASAVLIKKGIPNAFFLIVGEGEQRQEIEKIFKNHEMEDYLITGWVNNPMSYIRLFDVGTLFSRWEGFGLVLAEYMLAGKSIVASNVDAIPYVIENGVNGLLTELNLEEIVENVLKLFCDTELREKLSKNGRERVREKYNVKRVVKEHEELFKVI